MCRAVTCKTCGRPTWKGCGAHVEQVLGHVAPADRCRCDTEPTVGDRASAADHPTAGVLGRWRRRAVGR